MRRKVRNTSRQLYRRFLRLLFIACTFMLLYSGLDNSGSKLFTLKMFSKSTWKSLFSSDIYYSTQNVSLLYHKSNSTINHFNLTPVKLAILITDNGVDVNSSLTLIKSAIIFSSGINLQVFIFKSAPALLNQSENQRLNNELRGYVQIAHTLNLSFKYEIIETSLPANDANCKSQQFLLFLPSTLKEVDTIIYLDVSTIFVASLKEIWNTFNRMKSEQVLGFNIELENEMNGVVFLNLTKMKEVGFHEKMNSICDDFTDWTPDLSFRVIVFETNPNLIHQLDCSFNYRTTHCLKCEKLLIQDCVCQLAEENGIKIINYHGFSEHLPFKIIHQHFGEFNLATGSPWKLLARIKSDLAYLRPSMLTYPCLKSQNNGKLLAKFQSYLNNFMEEEFG